MTDKGKAYTALSRALKLEQDGLRFYLRAVRQTADEKGRAMFKSLADDERMHLDMIKRQLHALGAEGSYVLLPDIDVPDIDLEEKLFPPEREQVEAKIGMEPGELDALHLALDNENKSYALYVAAAQETDDEAGKQIYLWLADAERTHFNLLMSNYTSLVSTGGWV